MTNETIGILSLIIALFSTIYAIFQNIKAKKYQNKLADVQGVFAKSNIKFECFQTFYNDIIFVGHFPENSGIILPFEIYIGNIGDKKIKNSKLFLTYPDAIHEWKMDNLKIMTKGCSIEPVKYNLADKSEYKHMLGFYLGDIGPGDGIRHTDFLVIGDFKNTDTTILKLKTEVETADNVKGILTSELVLNWIVQYILRHEEGSEVGDCKIQIWNTTKKSFNEYIEYCKPKLTENDFEKHLEKYGLLQKTLFKKRLRKEWERTVQKTYLIMEIELSSESIKYPKPKNMIAREKNFKIFNGKIKNQKFGLSLNNGNLIAIDRQEYEKIKSTSRFYYI
jgi:hypothetical protein